MKPDEDARREYWVEQMETAYDFMMQTLDYPVEECMEPFASMPDAAEEARVEVVFSDTKIVNDLDRVFMLRAGLLEDFVSIARKMNERGWILKVEDGFRTREIQKFLARKKGNFDTILERVIWESGGEIPTPELLARRMAALIAFAPKVGTHMSGSAIDISVQRRDDGMELDRGGPYIELSELTPMASPFVSDEARINRKAITELMEHHGFMAYPYEFWHYNKGDVYDEFLNKTGRPGRYGAVDWDPEANTVSPIEKPEMRLNSLEEIQEDIEQALKRREER